MNYVNRELTHLMISHSSNCLIYLVVVVVPCLRLPFPSVSPTQDVHLRYCTSEASVSTIVIRRSAASSTSEVKVIWRCTMQLFLALF